MADIKITELTSYADPKNTDELAIVDLVADVTKRTTLSKLLQNAAPGTAAAPGITFDDRAANTGIYSPNDYQVGIATNGISRILCRENGYVGINKASPTAPFDVVGNSVITGTLNVTGNAALSADLTVTGNLTVNGTTTTVNSTTVTIDDKNIELGSVAAPTNTTADGGGITLRGATDKTWNWVNSTSSWTSSEHINLASGKVYKINGTEVLSDTALASTVQITSANITNGTIVNEDISASAEIDVSKLADGTARQLLQTDAAGTDVEWASNIDIPGTLDVTGVATFDQAVTIAGDLTVNGTTTTVNSTTVTVDDKNIELGVVDTPSDTTADGGGITLKGATDKTINWVDATDAWTFSEHIDIASAKEFRIAGTKVLDATSLGSAVVSSSLTSVGTLTGGALGTGFTTIATAQGGTGQTTYSNGELLIGKTDGTLAKATLTAGNGIDITNADGGVTVDVDLKANGGLVLESTELAVDLGASAITGTLGVADGGTGQTSYTDGELLIGTTAGSLAKATLTAGTGISVTNGSGSIAVAIDSSVVTTSDTGTVTSTMILDGTIVNSDINASAAIADTKLDTISTAGKVSNSATTATDANTASAIVARDASGDFSAGTITADLTGNADTATALETARDIGGVSFDGTANIDLPGVNTAGDQDTTGNAATATALETGRTIGGVSFDGTANIDLPGVNTTGNQDTSGNAATATKLDSSRTFEVTGDVTGTVSSDLTSGASIATSIASGVIVNADVNASAAIAGTKIDPDFGAQNVETTGDLDINTGLLKVTSSSSAIGFFSATPAAQPSAIADITSTATSGALPTADGSITIADAATPTVTELLEYCVELESKLETALAALRTLGLIAT